MKSFFSIIIVLVSIPLFAESYSEISNKLFAGIPVSYQKETMVVFPFAGINTDLPVCTVATDEITNAMFKMGANLVEREQLRNILKERELKDSGITNSEAAEIAAGAGAKTVLVGTVTTIDKNNIMLSLRLVEVSTYKLLAVESGYIGKIGNGEKKSIEQKGSSNQGSGIGTTLEFDIGRGIYTYKNDKNTVIDNANRPVFGVRLTSFFHENFSSSFEFRFFRLIEDGLYNNVFKINWLPSLRIPLNYFVPVLGDITDFHLGYSIGFAGEYVKKEGGDGYDDYYAGYYDDYYNDDLNEWGYGICTSIVAGFRVGITDNFFIYADYRYTPSMFNNIWVSYAVDADGDQYEASVNDDISGKSICIGMGLVF